MTIDVTTEFGARVARRLQHDEIIWLVTIDSSQTPQPSPVWFYWDGNTILIYSKPDTPKLRNIARTARVALNLNSGEGGDDIIVLVGGAQIEANPQPADQIAPYVAKYANGIKNIGMTASKFAHVYSAAVRVTPEKIRGH